MKIAVVCSHGGHLTETLQLLDAFEGHSIFFVTYPSSRDQYIQQIAPIYLTPNIGFNIFRLIKSFGFAWKVLMKEKPDVVFSLGAEIAVPFLIIGKLLRKNTIYIESWCRVTSKSLSGKILYPIVDEFWVQWPEMLEVYGPKAKFMGAVL